MTIGFSEVTGVEEIPIDCEVSSSGVAIGEAEVGVEALAGV
jgi:hypothetical protein